MTCEAAGVLTSKLTYVFAASLLPAPSLASFYLWFLLVLPLSPPGLRSR